MALLFQIGCFDWESKVKKEWIKFDALGSLILQVDTHGYLKNTTFLAISVEVLKKHWYWNAVYGYLIID